MYNPHILVGNFPTVLKKTDLDASAYLIRQLTQPTAFLDADFCVVYASDSWSELFDFPASTVVGKNLGELFPLIKKEWYDILSACLKGANRYGEESFVNPKGQIRWFSWTNKPWYDDSENILGVIVELSDISYQKDNEISLVHTQNLLSKTSEIAKIGSWEFNLMTNKLNWSAMTKAIHEVPEDFVVDLETCLNFYKEGISRNTISMAFYNGIEHQKGWEEQLQIITAKGNERWVKCIGKPIFNGDTHVGFSGTFQDITDLKASKEHAQESEKLLRSVLDNLPVNVYMKDMHFRKTLVNKAECEFLGVKGPQEALGKTDFEFYDEEMAQIFYEEDLEVMLQNKPIFGKEYTRILPSGDRTVFLSSKIPLLDNENNVKGLIGISYDITDLKKKEFELRRLINTSNIQNKKLINFAHIVSHNLRSHTSNFSMLLDFLSEEEDPEEAERIFEMLLDASDQLLETLDNLNEVVDISTKVDIPKKSMLLKQQISNVTASLKAYLQENKALIELDIPEHFRIYAVPAYLESTLQNLVTNAVRYKHPDRDPHIKISAVKEGNKSVLMVRDNGLGIDLKKHGKKLFGMYKTFHNNKDSKGIGLYITKNQIEAMKGRITAESEVGIGTTFKVYLKDEN